MKFFTICCLLIFCIQLSLAQLPDSLRQHLDSAITIMKQQAYYADKVDWPSVEKEAGKIAASAITKEQLFPAIAFAFKQLNDHHGMFAQYNDQIKLTDSSAIKRYSENLLTEWAKGPKVIAQMIGSMAYLRMPTMAAFNQSKIDQYANWFADSMISLSKHNPSGWIVDLRLNAGGHIVPMMNGLAAFFKDADLAGYINRNNKLTATSFIKKHRFFLVDGDTMTANLKQSLPDLSNAKIAVLIGPGTGSSAEGVAINFLHFRNNSRLFGERTAGFANSTQGFVFNNDNSYLLLVTSMIGDKNKKPLPEIVTPQVVVKNNDLFNDLQNDTSVRAGLQWLK